MSKELTGDYRKFMDKKYLGSWDVPEGGDLVLTIASVEQNEVQNQQGKEIKLTLHFAEDYKPMILNKTNSESISKAVGSKRVENWVGNAISIYVAQVNAFGGTTDALRIREYAPEVKEAICEECGSVITAHGDYSVNKIVTLSKEKYGQALCWECSKERKEAANE